MSTTGTAVNIVDALYDKRTGIMTVTTDGNHTLVLEDQVKLVGIEFTCSSAHAGVTTTIYPDHDDPFSVIGITSATQFKVQVGASTLGTHM